MGTGLYDHKIVLMLFSFSFFSFFKINANKIEDLT